MENVGSLTGNGLRRNMSDMTIDEAKQRVALSRRTVSGWEEVGMSGRAGDQIRMLTEELQILDGIVGKHIELVDEIGPLIGRYQQMLLKAKLSLH